MTDEEIEAVLIVLDYNRDAELPIPGSNAFFKIEELIEPFATFRAQLAAAARADLAEAEVARLKAKQSSDLASLIDELSRFRDAIRNNIVVNDKPHTIVLPDGTNHSGPVVDFLHQLLLAVIAKMDIVLSRAKVD